MIWLKVLSLLRLLTAFVAAEVRFYNLTIHPGEAAPDGFSRPVYLVNGQQPAPLIEANEDDTLEVFVKNELPVETTLHWHGLLQRGTPHMDGVPGVTQYAIAPGDNFTYRFDLANEYGFYWYHSHFRAYYNDAIRGPVNILAKTSRTRPFESLASGNADVESLLQAERDAFSVLLTDWYHDVSDAVLREYDRTGVFPYCVDSLLANGMGRVQCLAQAIRDCGPDLCLGAPGHSSMSPTPSDTTGVSLSSSAALPDMSAMSGMPNAPSPSDELSMAMPLPPSSTAQSMRPRKRQTMDMPGMGTSLGPRGCTPPTMFRPGYHASDVIPETCVATTAPLLEIPAKTSLGWLALNLVNAGSTTKLTVSLDSHRMFVFAADGLFVRLQEVEVLHIGLGERYAVMIRLDQRPGDYYLRFASTPAGDMQQVVAGAAVVQYERSVHESSMVAMESSPKPPDDNARSMLDGDNSGVHMLLNGSAKPVASTLRVRDLAPFDRIAPPRHTNVTKTFDISQTGIVSWTVDGHVYSEPQRPIVCGNTSDGWNANTTIFTPFNASIDLILRVSPDSMDTMGHPMHLHGHKFWVLGSGHGDFPYSAIQHVPRSWVNLDDPPYRDTVELPPSGWAVIRYVSDNPGAWLLHCHVQWHLVSGMALVLVEGEGRLPALLASAGVTLLEPSTSVAGLPSATATPSSSSGRAMASGLAILEALMFLVFFVSSV